MGKRQDTKPGEDAGAKVSGDTPQTSGRQTQGGPPDDDNARGSSIQGPKQAAHGGPDGANQGGAPRGASRLEPSHNHDRQRRDRSGKHRGKS